KVPGRVAARARLPAPPRTMRVELPPKGASAGASGRPSSGSRRRDGPSGESKRRQKMFNQVTLVGNLGADPELRNTSRGGKVANFSLAPSRPHYSDGKIVRNERGYAEQETEWHRVVAFNGQAKSAEKCVKG